MCCVLCVALCCVVLCCVVQRNESEVSASTVFAVASILEHCSYINGSPQNTFVPGVVQMAERCGVFIAGDDFKSGSQWKHASNTNNIWVLALWCYCCVSQWFTSSFAAGQTKLKSVLVDYLVSAGIKPASIVSYNHLGNNDGCNLSAPQQFRSKEISKSNVVDDMVASNRWPSLPTYTYIYIYIPSHAYYPVITTDTYSNNILVYF